MLNTGTSTKQSFSYPLEILKGILQQQQPQRVHCTQMSNCIRIKYMNNVVQGLIPNYTSFNNKQQ
jgi:hypothetical protein